MYVLGFALRFGCCGLSLGLERHGFGLDVDLEGFGLDAICCLPDKRSSADPIPTDVLKRISHQIAPFITSLFNRSLAFGRFPVSFQSLQSHPP